MRSPHWLLLTALAASVVASGAMGAEIGLAIGSDLSVVEGAARLCPETNCDEGAELLRIPAGESLVVQDKRVEGTPFIDVVWYQVSYNGKAGWISEYTTSAAPKKPRLKVRPR
jgi:hypothetical protein